MNSIRVAVETGKKKAFVSAVDWPGWSRSARDEDSALQTLLDYGPRYSQVMQLMGIESINPSETDHLIIVERHEGDTTTDFGAPGAILDADKFPIERKDFHHYQTLLYACWQAFDEVVEKAEGIPLRKGPREGGRDLDKIVDHVLDGDRSYLSRLARTQKRDLQSSRRDQLRRTREAILSALELAVYGQLPEHGPRGGIIWPPRYFVRRVAWHVLDHAWEIEDRIE